MSLSYLIAHIQRRAMESSVFPEGRHFQGDGEFFRQGLAYPVWPESESWALFPCRSSYIYLLVEMVSGQLVFLRCKPEVGKAVRVNHIAKAISLAEVSLLTDFDQLEHLNKMLWTRFRIEARSLNVALDGRLRAIEKPRTNSVRQITHSEKPDDLCALDAQFPSFMAQLQGLAVAAFKLRENKSLFIYNDLLRVNHRGRMVYAQAIISYPLLQHLFTGSFPQTDRVQIDWNGITVQRDWGDRFTFWGNNTQTDIDAIQAARAQIYRAIEAEMPLNPLLSKLLGVPEETIRWAQRHHPWRIGRFWLKHPHRLLYLMARIPPEKRPTSRKDWLLFNRITSKMCTHRVLYSVIPYWLSMFARHGWERVAIRLNRLETRFPHLMIDTGDYLSELQNVLAAPPLGCSEPVQYYAKIMASIAGVNPFKLIAASQQWHNQFIQHTQSEQDASTAIAWITPEQTVIPLSRRTAYFLKNDTELSQEGMEMRHCVSGYGHNCRYMHAQIISLRNDEGQRTATAELRLQQENDELQFLLVQLRGSANAHPTKDDQYAMVELLACLNHKNLAETRLHIYTETEYRKRQQKPRDITLPDWRVALLRANLPEGWA